MGLESPPGLRPARSGAPRPAPESAPLRAPGDAAAPLSSIMATGAAPTAVKVRLAVCPAPCSLAPRPGTWSLGLPVHPRRGGQGLGTRPPGPVCPETGKGGAEGTLANPAPKPLVSAALAPDTSQEPLLPGEMRPAGANGRAWCGGAHMRRDHP